MVLERLIDGGHRSNARDRDKAGNQTSADDGCINWISISRSPVPRVEFSVAFIRRRTPWETIQWPNELNQAGRMRKCQSFTAANLRVSAAKPQKGEWIWAATSDYAVNKKRPRPSSSTRHVRRPVAKAPVSILTRLRFTSGHSCGE